MTKVEPTTLQKWLFNALEPADIVELRNKQQFGPISRASANGWHCRDNTNGQWVNWDNYGRFHPTGKEHEWDIMGIISIRDNRLVQKKMTEEELAKTKTAPAVTKRSVLESAIEAVSGERALNYGAPEANFERIAERWNVHLRNKFGPQAVTQIVLSASDVAMMMIDMKLARLENKDGHLDSWVDIAGYAACGGEITAKEPSE